MNKIGEVAALVVTVVPWVMGVVIASGFWQTFFSIVFAPYSWFLVAKTYMELYGIIGTL